MATDKLQKRMNSLHGLFERMKPEMQKALPKHLSADRMTRVFFTEVRKNPDLAFCSAESLAGALIQASQLGLEPGLMGQCYLIPFNNRKKGIKEVQFIIGYKGLIDLARRSGDLVTLYANPVHENDEFEYSYGVEGTLHHKPALKDRGDITSYYAFAKLVDGGYHYEVMSREDIENHAQKYSVAYQKGYGPWKDDFDAMACKTVVRQMMKYLPLSIELSESIATDDTVNRFEDNDLHTAYIEEEELDPEMEIHDEEEEEDEGEVNKKDLKKSIKNKSGNNAAPSSPDNIFDEVMDLGKEVHGKDWHKEAPLLAENISDNDKAKMKDLDDAQLLQAKKILESKAAE